MALIRNFVVAALCYGIFLEQVNAQSSWSKRRSAERKAVSGIKKIAKACEDKQPDDDCSYTSSGFGTVQGKCNEDNLCEGKEWKKGKSVKSGGSGGGGGKGGKGGSAGSGGKGGKGEAHVGDDGDEGSSGGGGGCPNEVVTLMNEKSCKGKKTDEQCTWWRSKYTSDESGMCFDGPVLFGVGPLVCTEGGWDTSPRRRCPRNNHGKDFEDTDEAGGSEGGWEEEYSGGKGGKGGKGR